MFTPRPAGHTTRRIADAVIRPHPFAERQDPDFPVLMRCDRCGKHAYGPRKHISEAVREHQETVCPARHTSKTGPLMRLFYPRQ